MRSLANGRPSVKEKRELARKQITEVSLELFLEKGYEETTTRDIINKAGILNGSLYNRFKSKDEILISIVKEATEEILENAMELLKRENNLLLAASFPAALELNMASKWRTVANLIYEVQRHTREMVRGVHVRLRIQELGQPPLPDDHDIAHRSRR